MLMVGDGPTMRKRGFTFICLTEPMMFLEAALKDLVTRTRKTEGGAPGHVEAAVP